MSANQGFKIRFPNLPLTSTSTLLFSSVEDSILQSGICTYWIDFKSVRPRNNKHTIRETGDNVSKANREEAKLIDWFALLWASEFLYLIILYMLQMNCACFPDHMDTDQQNKMYKTKDHGVNQSNANQEDFLCK